MRYALHNENGRNAENEGRVVSCCLSRPLIIALTLEQWWVSSPGEKPLSKPPSRPCFSSNIAFISVLHVFIHSLFFPPIRKDFSERGCVLVHIWSRNVEEIMTKTKDGRIIHMILESCGRFRIRYQAVSKTKQIKPNQNKRIEINRKKNI